MCVLDGDRCFGYRSQFSSYFYDAKRKRKSNLLLLLWIYGSSAEDLSDNFHSVEQILENIAINLNLNVG